ncbi:MAG: LacI family DNA-binding transcriptional regulator [Devosia sp.]|uniref:LacI family DNA-binding transcriptional regulator n=1 Tax=Devosia sp. TaxID=1871048 RepID=UPI001A58A431|nr:LacI family DNA-binding transcriptional regulator [Devosia sp.]MBL8596875.1 LacI family DNA-binding transcriptional regulator [Devosia sp.]
MDAPKKTPTIQDVARHAQVSAATVSRVLSSPERVSESTRDRVTKAVRDTGYTINQAARTLRMQRAKTILTAMPGIGNPFYSTILDAVVTTAASRGYGVLVTGRLGDDPAKWLSDYYQSNRADGLLLFDGFLDTRKLHAITGANTQMPLVAAYDELPDPQINSVITDNLQAAERAVAHLHALGHRRIGHISGPSRNTFPNERLVGFRKAMFEQRLETREDWIFAGDYTMAGGRAAAGYFRSLKEMPTAVFAGNDEMGIGLIAALRKAGIECPRDISVIGFDDISISENYSPALTTMRQPREEIGRIAVETLINILERTVPSSEPIRVLLQSELVVRESTAAPGRG